MKEKKERKIIHMELPSWALLFFMAVYCETLLYVWTMEAFVFGRFAAIFVFAMGFGALFACFCSLLPPKAGKITAVITAVLLMIVYFAEYLINDAFQTFMTVGTMQAGAGGVVSTYMSVVLNAVLKNLWRLAILLLPILAYAIFTRPQRTKWSIRGMILGIAVAAYAGALWIVHGVGLDAIRLRDAYSFDTAVRSFGLHTAFCLNVFSDPNVTGSDLGFEAEATKPSNTQEDNGDMPDSTEPPVIYGEHTLGLDFNQLADSAKNSNVAALHSYVANRKPAKENEYTGLFAGKNLIFITAEAFSEPVIDQELTPTLYRLASKGIQFTDYYQPVWSAGTTGGEFTNLVGHMPVDGSCMLEARQQELFLTMGNQLKSLGYSSAAFHNNDYQYYSRHLTHTYLGYDYFMGYGNGIEKGVKNHWPQSDLEMIDYTVPMYIEKQPFSVYYMSVSGHSNYSQYGNAMTRKNYDLVKDLEYSEPVKCYIAANLELEHALTSLLTQLEQAGILDDTVIVIAPDHYPYGLASSSTWGNGANYLLELFGEAGTDMARDQNRLIIWSGSIEGMNIVVDEPTYSLDILPTLSNLFGLEYDSRLFIGRDVFSDEDPLVIWGVSGSWKTDKGSYLAATGKFIPAPGVVVNDNYVGQIQTIVRNKLKFSKGISYYNYFGLIYDALKN